MSKVMVARKNLQTHSFDFPKIPAAKKNGSYKSVTATRVIFSPREQHPPTPIAHTHGHAKDLGPNQAVWAAIIFAAELACELRKASLYLWCKPVASPTGPRYLHGGGGVTTKGRGSMNKGGLVVALPQRRG